ncbi:testicular acid phosphatase-like [Ornithodoros turicata]|uniref:testicular acid phosphatase-like n=1 Tax=Ornithodoros turicata TaxID=34597 RepID=UPI003138C3B6
MARHVRFRTPPESAKAHVDVTSRVEYVFVLSRHGERTPLTQCSKLVKTSPEGYGQLTKTGRKQCKNLGKMLRERYPNLLKGQPGEVRATCDKLPRTFQGLRRTLKGLGFKDVIPAEDATDYDSIEVSALAKNYSSMMKEQCIGQFKTMRDILDYTVKNTGSPTKPEKAVLQSLDNVITHVRNGHRIPQWASGHSRNSSSLLFLLHMHLFMTSDVVVFSFVRLLCSTYDKRPPFCASFFFEVFLEKNEPRLHLMHYSEAVHASVAMDNLPNPCSVHEFTQELGRILKINK